MICEIDSKRNFYLEEGIAIEDEFEGGTPILACENLRFCKQVSCFLFKELGWTASQHVIISGDDCLHVLLLRPSRKGCKIPKQSVKTARAVAKAMAIGLQSGYLYRLDEDTV